MSYAAIAVAAGTAIAGVASSSAQRRDQKQRQGNVSNILNGLSNGGWNGYSAADIFGSRVAPAEFQNRAYNPLDYASVQGDTIAGNRANLPSILGLTDAINGALRNDSSMRIEQFAPGFGDNLKTMTNAAKSLVAGRLPYEDVMDIVSNRQGLGNTLGTAGTFGNATLKDLGLSRLQAMQTGSEMMSRIGNLVEAVDPIGQRSRPQDWTLAPTQTVPLKQADNQFAASYDQMERILAQQSEQNANVLNAAPDPAGRGLFGAEYAMNTGTPFGGATGGGFDWSGLISGIYGAYRQSQLNGGGSGGTGGGGTQQRYNPDSDWSWNSGANNTPPNGWENPNAAPFSY